MMKMVIWFFVGVSLLSGCGVFPLRQKAAPVSQAVPVVPAASEAAGAQTLPTPPPPRPPQNARTAEQFDTTSKADRVAAVVAPQAPSAGRALGQTVASLGDPSKPGFWLETPLVSAPSKGRVVNPLTGKAVQLELLPIAGASGAGSRLSLAAMRLLDVSLTDLPTLEVFAE